MFETSLGKKRSVGLALFVLILALFFSFNRFPKLDAVGTDLDAATGPEAQCFQGFCIERESGASLLSRWWVFSVTYLRLVTVGMTFAFLVAGLTEAFLFPSAAGTGFSSGGIFKRTVKGLAVGPLMNLCSACIVPVSTAFQKRGAGIEGAIAMVQGSATMNVPALAMVFFVFTPLLGFSRLLLAIIGALLIGPIVVLAVRRGSGGVPDPPAAPVSHLIEDRSPWRPVLAEAFRQWAKTSVGYLARMGPIMVVAGFASGLAIQWLSPSTVATYLGNDLLGVALAATLGILINVPLLFEIPLVALLLLLGMGTAPAATLLFTAAAGGPVTFWGLAKIMPKRGIAAFATATWVVGAFGGLAVLGVGAAIWDIGGGLRVEAAAAVEQPSGSPDSGMLASGASTGAGATDGPVFTDVTDAAGVAFLHHESGSRRDKIGAGVVIVDFDGDGFDDIYVTNSEGPNALYRNGRDGTFTDVAAAAGVDDSLGAGNGGCAADYDNDGDRDLYVTNYGPSRLFRNTGDATFEDVSALAGIAHSDKSPRSTGCAWGDFDQDGLLDLVVVRYVYDLDIELSLELLDSEDFTPLSDKLPADLAAGRLGLYRNEGDGTFEDVSGLLGDLSYPTDRPVGDGVGNLWGAGFQPGWLDFDNDGDLDLYIVNDMGHLLQPNVLWRNDGRAPDGSWRFADISSASGADVALDGMALAVGDYDLDGNLDLYMTNIGDSVLLKNNGDGLSFTDTTREAGVGAGRDGAQKRITWGALFVDHDNDGDEDLYVVSGYAVQRNLLLRNEGDGSFSDASATSGADDPGLGRGGAYLDFDKDGCLDLFVANYGQRARLFRNLCDTGNSWLTVDTSGTVSNRDGIGARVTVVARGKVQIREISGGSSQMGQNMLAAHFGLGDADLAEYVLVRWPSGVIQTLTDVAANQRITVTEPEGPR